MPFNPYCSPKTHAALNYAPDGLVDSDGLLYPFITTKSPNRIPNFIIDKETSGNIQQSQYTADNSVVIYKNFLTWLYATFNEDPDNFRECLINKLNLKSGDNVLITGCGLGDDLYSILDRVGDTGSVYAQDISPEMVIGCLHEITRFNADSLPKINLSISDACSLPFFSNSFDAVFHFGGINLFNNTRSAILEMNRVAKPGAKIVFGDEGIAPWLKTKEYGLIAINNNHLWGSNPPLEHLPETAKDVELTYLLGNCFYLISFVKSNSLPYMNAEIVHKGLRGGSMKTRYFGRLEGIDPKLKYKINSIALEKDKSLSCVVEDAIKEYINTHGKS